MKRNRTFLGIILMAAAVQVATSNSASAAGGPPVARPPTSPGTPALIAAGPEAGTQAKAALNKPASDADAASNPTEATPGSNPPSDVDGNFLIGPVYVRAPELTVNSNVPQGRMV